LLSKIAIILDGTKTGNSLPLYDASQFSLSVLGLVKRRYWIEDAESVQFLKRFESYRILLPGTVRFPRSSEPKLHFSSSIFMQRQTEAFAAQRFLISAKVRSQAC